MTWAGDDMTWAGEDVLPLEYGEDGYLTDESYALAYAASGHEKTGHEGICQHCRTMLMDDDGAEPCPDNPVRVTHYDPASGKVTTAPVRQYAVRDEYAPRFGRQELTLWSGAFASDFEGWATELPGHDGYMVRLEYGVRVRVSCESPRTDENYVSVDAAISRAIADAQAEK